MPVHASPASTLVNFKVESVPLAGGVSRLEVLATGGHRLTGAGMRAILATMNTYYNTTLNAAQCAQLDATNGALITKLNSIRLSATVLTTDLTANANVVGSLVANLQAAGAVVGG